MDENNLKIGDIVRLNSGGPKMTVYDVDVNVVRCVYINQTTQKSEYFDADFAMLEKLDS